MKKQYYLSLGTLAAAAIPIVATVSCNGDKSGTSTTASPTQEVKDVAALLTAHSKHETSKLSTDYEKTQVGVLKLLQEEASVLKQTHLEISDWQAQDGSIAIKLDVVEKDAKESINLKFDDLITIAKKQDADDLATIKSLPRVFHAPSMYTGSFSTFKTIDGGGTEFGQLLEHEPDHPKLNLTNWIAELQVGDIDQLWQAAAHMDSSNVVGVEFILTDPNFDVADVRTLPFKHANQSMWQLSAENPVGNAVLSDTMFFYLTVRKGNVTARLHCCVTDIKH